MPLLVGINDTVRSRLGALEAVGISDIVAQPRSLATPVGRLISLPGVWTATSESERLEAHGLERHVASQDEEISPRELAAVLLLDGPQQAASLVQAHIVGPAVEGCEALLALFER